MVQIRCENLTKVFSTNDNPITAVDSVDMTIEDGTFVTLLGPSGCGKTTLLRMLAGLETSTEGTIYYDDEDVTNTSVQDRKISMVFQSIALFPFKTVQKNIEYGLKYLDVEKGERERRATEMAEMVGIEELVNKKPTQLSGGQQQRVALSRALVRDPNVFLLDEPMSALDAELKVDLRTELKELHNEFETTTLYVTHDQEEAMTLSEEVIVMKDGEIQQKAPPVELFQNPVNMFVSRFIGSPNINFFAGSLEEDSISVPGFEEPLPLTPRDAKVISEQMTGSDLQVGIRPSALTMVNTPADAYFTADTRITEQLGDETILHAKFHDGDSEQEIRALIPPNIDPDEGETISFTFSPDKVHVFNGNTGEIILNGLSMESTVADTEVQEQRQT